MEEDKKNNIKGYMLAILGGVSWGISGVCSQVPKGTYTDF